MRRCPVVCVVVTVSSALWVPISCAQSNSAPRLAAVSAVLSPFPPQVPPPPPETLGTDRSQPASAPEASFPAGILSQIPSRVSHPSGQPGDLINLFIIGEKRDLIQALRKAGWYRVSRCKFGTTWRDTLGLLHARAYRGLSMSTLYLFGRPQDISYARPEHFINIARRHHFRLWRSPFQVDGQTLWVAAATHDIGVRFAKHHVWLMHRIDPDIDAERQFISNTLSGTGRVQVLGYVTPLDAPSEAQTATGEAIHTDGRALVLRVMGKGDAPGTALY